jgi:signal transduction histidine kinase/ActR/RegA family two-component response regulator
MDPYQRRLTAVAMAARARQWPTRLGIGALIALLFFTMTGAAFAAGWVILYAALQALELRVFQAGRRPADWIPSALWSWLAVAFIAVSNSVFGAFAARQALSSHDLGLVAAALLIAGAIVNGVIVSAGSRHLTWASIGPQIVCFSALAVATARSGTPSLETAQIGAASLLFVLAAAAASTQLSRKLKSAEDARRQAEAANSAKSQFLATMSHEIRTPLNGVVSMVDLLSRSALEPRELEMVKIIRGSSETLGALLSDILDMARIEAGEMALDAAPYHMGDSLRAVCALFSPRAAERGLRLNIDIATEVDRWVVGDQGRLRQVLNNLVSNALKFTEVGQVAVTARLLSDGFVRLEVADTGIGFDAGSGANVFDRFQQADGSITRRFGGTGLGLAICRDLVRLMGGSMGCSSTPGVGSAFWAKVPFHPTEPGAAQAAGEDCASPGRPLRLLVADDHPTNIRVVELILAEIGVDTTAVQDGAAAVAAFRIGGFDMILMDMQMPVMDGLSAIREIRRLEQEHGTEATPIAVLSANAMVEHVEAAMKAGADECLSKPIKPGELISSVMRLTA